MLKIFENIRDGKYFPNPRKFALVFSLALTGGSCISFNSTEPSPRKLNAQEKDDFKAKATAIVKESTDEVLKKFDEQTIPILKKRGKDDTYIDKHKKFFNEILSRRAYIMSNPVLNEISNRTYSRYGAEITSSKVVEDCIESFKSRMNYLLKDDQNIFTNLDILLSGEFDYNVSTNV